MKDALSERVHQVKKVLGTLKTEIRSKAVSMELKKLKLLHDNIISPTLTYESETWALLETIIKN